MGYAIVVSMTAGRIVKQLNIIEDLRSSVIAGFIYLSFDTFCLQKREKAFRYGIVMTMPSAAHARFQIMICNPHSSQTSRHSIII